MEEPNIFTLTVIRKTIPASTSVTLMDGELSTVNDLKREVQLIWDIHPDDQLLVHEGYLLHKTHADLDYYGIEDGASIDLHQKDTPDPFHRSYKPLTVTVEHRDGHITLTNVETKWSVGDLKREIDKHIGVPPLRQSLEYMGAMMKEEERMYDYVIDSTPTVQLFESPRERKCMFFIDVVNVVTKEGETIGVEPWDTVSTVSAEMRRRGLNRGEDFYLMFKESRLPGNSDMVGNKIINGDSIQMIIKGPIGIGTVAGNSAFEKAGSSQT